MEKKTGTQCVFVGCDKNWTAQNLCFGHYAQKRRGKELTPLRERKHKPNDTYCTKCDTQKTRADFGRRGDGLQSKCKDCTNKNSKEYYQGMKAKLERLEMLEEMLSKGI